MRAFLIALAAGLILAAPASAQSTTLVINEVDYDQPSFDTAEFVEIKNVAATPIDLDPYALRLVNGANNAIYGTIDLPDVDLAGGARFVICGGTVTPCDLDLATTRT
jgi:hypothetical protein